MELSKATDNELEAECKKRGYCMVEPLKISFSVEDVEGD